MYLKLSFAIAVIYVVQVCYAQRATRQAIDSSFRKLDSTFNAKRAVMYVLNGIHYYDSLQIDSALQKYDLKTLKELTYISCEKANLYHCYKDAAIFLFTQDEKDSIKRSKWKRQKTIPH